MARFAAPRAGRRFVAERSSVRDGGRVAHTASGATSLGRPEFLRRLRPTMVLLGSLVGPMTPLLYRKSCRGADINPSCDQLGPFSRRREHALQRLGDASDSGG